jgi:hypothetical protein
MSYLNQFDTFDPVAGYIPEYPMTYLPEIGNRARALLLKKEKDRLVVVAKKVGNLIDEYFEHAKELKIYSLQTDFSPGDEQFDTCFEWDGGTESNGRWLFKDAMLDELGVPTEENTSEIDALKLVIEERDSCFFLPQGTPEPEPEEYAEGKDYELFAVLSLCLLSDSLRWINNKSMNSLSIASGYAIKAMEAVCYAEHLKQAEWLVHYAKSTASKELTAALRKQKEEHSIKLRGVQKENDDRLRKVKSDIGKTAVAQRVDQKLKPGWIKHCLDVKNSGVSISRLSDLLSAPDCDPAMKGIGERTLKDWAKATGIEFKAGRPKK